MKLIKTYNFYKKAKKIIPLGAQTFSKSSLVYPKKYFPLFSSKAKGCEIWDLDGNKYIDLINGLLPVILGYQDSDVDKAISAQLKKGITTSLSSELELKLSKILINCIPSAEMVRFAKNGADATAACVRLARAYTKKNVILCCGYHGWHDWYIGTTSRSLGVPKNIRNLSIKIPYNDLVSLEKIIKKNQNKIAALIMEPVNFIHPKKNYLSNLKKILKKNKILLIFDEVCTGFRMSLGGAQEYFKIKPDLSAFGKAMGNGMPIAAVVGKKKIMNLCEKIFLSQTFSGETLSLAASIRTLQKIKSKKVIQKIWITGKQLKSFIELEIKKNKLEKYIGISGYPPWTILNFKNFNDKIDSWYLKTFFIISMANNGVLINSTNNISFAIKQKHYLKICKAYKKTFFEIKKITINKKIDKIVMGNKVKPVFNVR